MGAYGTLIFKNGKRLNETFLDTEIVIGGVKFNFYKFGITANDEEVYWNDASSDKLVYRLKTPIGTMTVKPLDTKMLWSRSKCTFHYDGELYIVLFGWGIDDNMTPTIFRDFKFTNKEIRIINKLLGEKE